MRRWEKRNQARASANEVPTTPKTPYLRREWTADVCISARTLRVFRFGIKIWVDRGLARSTQSSLKLHHPNLTLASQKKPSVPWSCGLPIGTCFAKALRLTSRPQAFLSHAKATN
jgi:hypothetical protein